MYISVLLMIAINFTLHLNSFSETNSQRIYISNNNSNNIQTRIKTQQLEITHTHTQMRTSCQREHDDEHKRNCNNRKESLILLFVRYKGCDCLYQKGFGVT